MEPIGNPQFGYTTDDVFQHVAASGHYEPNVVHPFKHLGCCLDKVIGPFLIGDPAQKGDDLVGDAAFGLIGLFCLETYGVVDRYDLLGGNPVFLDDDVPCQVAHGDHTVCGLHAGPFDVVDLLIDVFAAPVEFCRVHVYH